ncbi:hypothetical protein TgHK011_002529 [Trichoderma gracile]|nr:hypothetical protein TgHK011_002529 [Trichoderma gracile]
MTGKGEMAGEARKRREDRRTKRDAARGGGAERLDESLQDLIIQYHRSGRYLLGADLGEISGQRPTNAAGNATLQQHKAHSTVILCPTARSRRNPWAQTKRINSSVKGPTTSRTEQDGGPVTAVSIRLGTDQPVPVFARPIVHLEGSPVRLFGLLDPLWVGGWWCYSVGLSGGDMS